MPTDTCGVIALRNVQRAMARARLVHRNSADALERAMQSIEMTNRLVSLPMLRVPPDVRAGAALAAWPADGRGRGADAGVPTA